jgi:hypothetical protein
LPDCASALFDLLAARLAEYDVCAAWLAEVSTLVLLALAAPATSAVEPVVLLVLPPGLSPGGGVAVQPPAKGSPEVLTVGGPAFVLLLLFVSVVSAFVVKPCSLSAEVSLSWRK